MSGNNVIDGRCYTEEKFESAKFQWKINDFTRRKEILRSPEFPSSTQKNIGRWRFSLFPGDTFITVCITQLADIEIMASIKVYLINDKGSIEKSKITEYKTFYINYETKIADFVERGYVLNKDNGVLSNDELTIVFEIQIRRSSEIHYVEFLHTNLERPLCRLAEDMGNLLSSKSLTDLTITVGERQFSAHKAILAARSPVFAAMFRNEMEEKKSSTVKITDIDPDVFQEMLEFIYTGKEISQTNRTTELLAAANKYQLDRLKFLCEEAFCKLLSVDNVLENIALADLYKASYLKEYALQFVMINNPNVIRSSAWEIFKHSHQSLAIDILEQINSKLNFKFL